MVTAALVIILFVIIYIIQRVLNSHKLWHEPSHSHVNNIINNSYFFVALTPLDLKARKVSSQEEYIKLYKSRLKKFSHKEKQTLNNLMPHVKLFPTIKPYIVKFENVENNFPHTLGDIIFLPQSFFTISTQRQIEILNHEKVHIYQRTYTIETAKYIESMGFKVAMPHNMIPNIRTNPDTNSFAYSYNGTVQAQTYNSDTPESITDSSTKIISGSTPWNFNVQQQDHPFEIMACHLSKNVSSASASGSTPPLL